MGVPRKNIRQVHLYLDLDEYALLLRLSKRSGRSAAAEAKALVLDVLHDDAVAHAEMEARNEVA